MKKVFLILLCFNIYLNADENIKFYNPSFDCNKVKKDSIEYEICINKDLSLLDKELSRVYKKLLEGIYEKNELKEEQREFLKNREICIQEQKDKNYCVDKIYRERLYILESIYKFNNVNLDDYKSEKIKYIDIIENTRSKLLVKKLLEKIDIFEKQNYILTENGFLFEHYSSYLADGLYYASTKTGTITKLIGGSIGQIIFLKNFDISKIVLKENSSKQGLGNTGLYIINIKDDNYNFINDVKTLITYRFYMESYYCGLENLDWLYPEIIKEHKKAGHIENYEYDEINNFLKIRVIEQDCSSYEYKEKQIIYDLKKNLIIDEVENKLIYDSEKDIFINLKDK